MIGESISHYRIIRRLGEGGMGVLYCAEDLRLGRLVALKFLREEAGGDAAALERFQREARAASALNNPHICTVHDIGLHEGRPFIVMELLEGRTLAHRLKEGPLVTNELLDLAIQMAEALSAAHGKGIVHRDLKPANAFLTESGLLKVLDFGVAKLQHEPTGETTSVHGLRAALLENDDKGATPPGVVPGTPSYMSPEQARGLEIDARSDLFSFGAVLFEMAAGFPAFTGRSAHEVIEAVLSGRPPPPSRFRRNLPRALDKVILKALEKAPDDRYQSADDMLRTLRSIQADAQRVSVALGILPKSWRGPASTFLAPVTRRRRTPSRPAGNGPAEDTIGSLAVMPVQALSGGEQEQLLADGVTDSLIGHLSQIRAVRVISRTSVLRYKATTKTVREIARELRVDGLVEGSLLLSGGRVRVTARLIQAALDRSVWNGTYDRELRDVLTLQSDLAHAVAREIRVALTPEERDRLVRRRPVDPEAHFSYLRGRFLTNRGSPQDLEQALQELHAAVKRDPTFAPAWAGIASAYATLGGSVYAALPPRQVMPLAKAAAERALEIEPSSQARAVLGYIAERYEFDFTRAKQELALALDLDPGSAATRNVLASHLCNLGWFDEAIAEAGASLALDPFSMGIRMDFGWCHYMGRRFDEAADLARQMLALEPTFAHSRCLLGLSLLETGEPREGAAQLETFLVGRPDDVLAQTTAAYARARLGDTGGAMRLLGALLDSRRTRYVGADRIAAVYAVLGENDQCMEWLETALEERSSSLVILGVHPLVDGLRSDPRFQDLARRVGLPSADLRPPTARHRAQSGSPSR